MNSNPILSWGVWQGKGGNNGEKTALFFCGIFFVLVYNQGVIFQVYIMDQEIRFIGSPSNSDCLKGNILTTLEGKTSFFILVVGPRRVGKDY
ncbi:MAG: hypothetical protein ACKO57_01135, partial [Alphaproteobacteria bacterium]